MLGIDRSQLDVVSFLPGGLNREVGFLKSGGQGREPK